MALFDPPYKKIILKSPAYFQQSAPIWGAMLEAAIEGDPLLTKAGNLFRAAVVGNLALYTAYQDPANWSLDSVQYIQMTTNNAERLLPETIRQAARALVEALVTEPQRDHAPSSEPSPENAGVIEMIDNLLDLSEISSSTRMELEEFRAQAKQDHLDSRDADYVRTLHSRMI